MKTIRGKKLNQSGFHAVELVFVIVIIGLIGFIGFKVFSSKGKQGGKNNPIGIFNKNKNDSGSDDEFVRQFGQKCEDKDKVSFTKTPLALDQMSYFDPLGKVSDGHVTPTDHIYLAPLNPAAADNTTDVYMPADGKVVEIDAMPAQYIGDKNQQTAPEDHRIVMSFSCRYYSIFIHVHQLSDALKSAVGQMQPNTQKMVEVKLNAGDKIGKIGGSTFDWIPVDINQKLSGFITPENYKTEAWKIHVVDPVSLYTGDLKAKFAAKSLRTKEPVGGKIDYDKKGALIGNWFRQGSGGYSGGDSKNTGGRYWDGHLSIAPHNIDPSATIVSIGYWDGKAAQFTAKGSFDAASITEKSGVVKIELIGLTMTANGKPWQGMMLPQKPVEVVKSGSVVGTLLVQVQAGEKLKVEKFIGKSASQVNSFTSAAQLYDR